MMKDFNARYLNCPENNEQNIRPLNIEVGITVIQLG